jgi:hypothetical protein
MSSVDSTSSTTTSSIPVTSCSYSESNIITSEQDAKSVDRMLALIILFIIGSQVSSHDPFLSSVS